MWSIYLAGGLAVIGILFIAIPLLAVRGISALAEIFSRSEVEDDET